VAAHIVMGMRFFIFSAEITHALEAKRKIGIREAFQIVSILDEAG
jgi:hypothetical protein